MKNNFLYNLKLFLNTYKLIIFFIFFYLAKFIRITVICDFFYDIQTGTSFFIFN